MSKKLIYLMSFVLVLAVTGTASADQIITINNPGFEDPVLAEDGWTWLDTPGWTQVGGESHGVWNVTLSDFDPVVAPEGQNILYTENAPAGVANGAAQVLTDTFAANTDYTLTVDVGNSWEYYWSGYSVQLLAGGIVIAEDNDTLWPEYMKWATSTVQYTYDSADSALVGQPLEIRLLNLGLDKDSPPGNTVGVEFDNVTLLTDATPVNVLLENWEAAVALASPGFLATNVENGTYDIGAFSGDMTYEFVVNSNPDEQEASMALIGRLNFGDTRAGLKYEQWENTGTYGATVFGVADHDYGVGTKPGLDTHLVFVSSGGETTLYVNGAYRGSIGAEISLSGVVGIGRAIREDGTFVDNFDGSIFGVAIYDTALSADQIQAHSDAYFMPLPDVTAPGDTVKGVPDDGDWPGTEPPPMVIDDNVNTKYLHFKGGSMVTGFVVTPLAGASIVTGMTFTTANDTPARDPITFELSGSNESIDGPYELIASGDIVDFNEPSEWPRFTKNETPISFDNEVAYEHYKIMFPTLRGPTEGLMQIAEVELLGIKLNAGTPNPANGAENVVIGTTLSWSAGNTAATHDVYFGTSNPPAFIGNQEATTYYPGPVEVGTTYYWRVDDVEADGTTKHINDVWSFTTGFSNFALDISIATGTDDAEEDVGGSASFAIDLTSTDLELMHDNNPADPLDEQVVGLRFVDIGIPKGAAITSASVRFDGDDVDDPEHVGNAYILIDGELNPDPVTFENTANNITARPRTTTQVPWISEPWPADGGTHQKALTADISSIIQEIVDQDGWAAGNALVLILSQDPATPSVGHRECESFNGAGGNADQRPMLSISALVEAATGPNPANGAENVPIDTNLSWWPGFGAVSHDGYMGTSSPPAFIGNTPEVTFDPGALAPGTTYYWQLNAVEADGTTHTGDIWSFTTEPGEATQPDPANNAVGVALDATLSWSPGVTAATHDVYFGTSSPPAFIGNQAEASFDPGPLEMETTYYWQVDEIEADGTTVYTGDVWSFKTPRPETGTILYEIWDGIGGGNEISILTGNANYPGNPTSSTELSSFDAPVDRAEEFGGRLHGYLHPDTSGDYTFWIASDDNGELWLSTDESPANAVLISTLSASAGHLNFDDSDLTPSGPIPLAGGQKYYIMALYKEGGGGDNCAVAWEGPDSPTRAVIHGYYLSPYVEFKAASPDPADGATEVPKTLTLSWTPGATAATHDVYFSADSAAVIDGTALIGNQAETTYTPAGLEKGITYYWRVDEVDADGTTKHTGDVWSFTVTTLGR